MNLNKTIGFLGFILLLYGLISAILFSSPIWFSFYAIGGTFFIGYINVKLKNISILKELNDKKLIFLLNYVFYIFAAILIELFGRGVLNLWHYPSLDIVKIVIHVFLIGYPFCFFFIRESYRLLGKFVKNKVWVFALTAISNAFIIEIPNTFAWEWKYTIHFLSIEFFNTNILVILGWFFLVFVAIIVDKIKINN